MATKVRLIANCDDAVVFWGIDKAIKDCWGFAIEREQKTAVGGIQRITLDNRTGFEFDKPKLGEKRPSNVWPFQRFWWADYSANNGDTVRYRVTPMVRSGGQLREDITGRSEWTQWTELSGDAGDKTSVFFNRGLVISQFMSRYLEKLRVDKGLATRKDALVAFKKSLDDHELPIRKFLAGTLRDAMLELLKDAKKGKKHVYGALYELEDEELVGALKSLGARCHVVLANGSIQSKKGVPAAEARKKDQNKTARKALKDAGVEVFGRFISPGALGHNKFLVVAGGTSAAPKPQAVWSGSTNWTKTGLCTQINNGILIEQAAVAREFMAQWQRLRDAKSAFPKTLVDSNSKPKKVPLGGSRAEIWFTRAAKKVDLDALDAAVKGAKEGVLFLMFQPGGAGTLASVRALQKSSPGLYLKGVVSTLPSDSQEDEDHVEVSVHSNGKKLSVGLDVVQPQGTRPFANWAATVTRQEFIPMSGGVVGFAIVHSKLIVIDPFTKPVVITGSHNFSGTASAKNDENFLIIRDNKDLATEYAAHILSVYHHYRWQAHVHEQQKKKKKKNPYGYLRRSDEWQSWQLKDGARKEIDFWLG
jgi:phosphatidylserine/phosphatidylglycerophosphate/cardiolipin synthase-like enzyme